MKNKDLIEMIERNHWIKSEYGECIKKYLKELKEQNPNLVVMFDEGTCDRDGVFVPIDENGKEVGSPKPIREGEDFPEEHRWVRII